MRLMRLLIVGAVFVGAAGLLVFCFYGWSNGYAVHTALYYLLKPNPAPVASNPSLTDMQNHEVRWVADIVDPQLNESSGLTSSDMHEDVLWSINDSGGGPVVYALNLNGETLATFEIEGVEPRDWEAMDSFVSNGRSYLVIGDIGDNFRWRNDLSILVIAEPTVAKTAMTDAVASVQAQDKLRILQSFSLTPPDGPRDFEAMAVDMKRERILFVSKRTRPPEVYAAAFPIRTHAQTSRGENSVAQSEAPVLTDNSTLMLKQIATLDTLPQPSVRDYEMDRLIAKYRHMPTGMDVIGDWLLLTTYKHAYLFDVVDLEASPMRVTLPTIGQREAITFAAGDASSAFLSRERVEGTGDADLFQVRLALPNASPQTRTEAIPDAIKVDELQ